MPSLRVLAAIAFLLAPLTHAQKPVTPDAPRQTGIPADAALNSRLPTVFIVGDSTARNEADLGWGDHFAPLFDTTKINVGNRAVAGRSSRSYINEGRWDKVLAEMKPGDFVLIQMGHNDSINPHDPKRRGTLPGVGNETEDIPQPAGPLAGQVETVHTYGWYLRKYIAETRARGAAPILLTCTIRNIWKDGQIERDMGYRDFEYQVAAAEHVPLADMASLAADRLQALGPEKAAALFPIDHTHSSAEGAALNARDVAAALRAIHSPLAGYLKP